LVEISGLRLQDFAAFRPFARIANYADTEIVLHGGAAFRAALYAAYQDRLDVDLFDLVPFNSDIDLDHGGSPEKTAKIAHYIDRFVPFAGWCRWSINDAERAVRARTQRETSTDVPLRRIRFSTAGNADIPEAAFSDINNQMVSFRRNPNFGKNGSAARSDLELFGLMMALNSWEEAKDIRRQDIGFDEDAARAWIRQGLDDKARAQLSNPGIAARFWHLLSLRLARCGIDDLGLQLIEIGKPILDKLDISLDQLRDGNRAISVSKMTSTARFRVPQLTPVIVTGEAAVELFRDVIRRAARLVGLPDGDLPEDPSELIDPSFDLIGVVPDLTLIPYETIGEEDYEYESNLSDGARVENENSWNTTRQEFVQFAWEVSGADQLYSGGLTGQILALGARDFGSASALPVVGGLFGRSRAWVRVRLDDLLECEEGATTVKAVLLILQARPDETGEVEGNPKMRTRSIQGEAVQDGDLPPVYNYEYEYSTTQADKADEQHVFETVST
jgi:hypothetical protein